MAFRKRKEDFVCEHCNAVVIGDGYTNHCPKCLWSKHVDVDPGDRRAECGGMMEPVDVENFHGDFRIEFVCQTCGFKRPTRVSAGDDFAGVLAIAKKAAEKKEKLLG